MQFLSFATVCLVSFLLSGFESVSAAPVPAASCKPKRVSTGSPKSNILSDIFPSPTATSASDDGASTSTATPTATVSSHAGKSTATSSPVSHKSSVSASSKATATASSSAPSSSSSSAPSSSSSDGARFVIYTDSYISSGNGLPDPSDLKGFNVLALSFLLGSGPADQALQWTTLSDSDRAAALKAYHAAGIKVIVSAFGETESPTTSGEDPVDTANTMAAWVKKYDLDGIDVDYEDFDAFNSQSAEAIKWLESFTRQLRNQLPAGQYTISHAPVAPWFTKDSYQGGYLTVDKSVGDLIDWYNVQFYNQGADMYSDCDGLLNESGSAFPGTALFQISDAGVSMNKLVIGKPAASSDASNGFIAQATLATCVAQAQKKGWNAGVMSWEFPNAEASWIQLVRGAVFPLLG